MALGQSCSKAKGLKQLGEGGGINADLAGELGNQKKGLPSSLHEPWLVWLSGLSTSLQTKGLVVQFAVRSHAWVEGQVPSRGCVRHPHIDGSLPLSPSLPLLLMGR